MKTTTLTLAQGAHGFPLAEEMAIEPSAIARFASPGAYTPQPKYGEQLLAPGQGSYPIKAGIAVITIEGALDQRGSVYWPGYDSIRQAFEAAIGDPMVRAVVLKLNSPGGVAAGCFEAVLAMRKAKAAAGKPVIAFADEHAYSAAYAIACVADQIYLPPSGGVGSVGCIMALFDVSKMLDEQGIRVVVLTSGEQKGDGHPAVPLAEDVITRFQARTSELGRLFAELVGESRGKTTEEIAALEAGCLYGKAAVTAGLADGVKSFDDVMKLAAKTAFTSSPRAAARPETTHMSTMIAIAAVCAALMLPTEATEAQVLEKIREDREKHARLEAAKKESDADLAAFQKRVFEATKTDNVEAAFGAIDAGNEARTQLVAANKSLSEIQAQRDEQEKAALIAQAEKDHKLTPHTKKTLEGKPLAYVKEHVELLVPIPALANSVDTTKGEDKGSDAEAKTSDGKRYEDLTPGERAKIRSESPSLYESLRADFEARGKPEKK